MGQQGLWAAVLPFLTPSSGSGAERGPRGSAFSSWLSLVNLHNVYKRPLSRVSFPMDLREARPCNKVLQDPSVAGPERLAAALWVSRSVHWRIYLLSPNPLPRGYSKDPDHTSGVSLGAREKGAVC